MIAQLLMRACLRLARGARSLIGVVAALTTCCAVQTNRFGGVKCCNTDMLYPDGCRAHGSSKPQGRRTMFNNKIVFAVGFFLILCVAITVDDFNNSGRRQLSPEQQQAADRLATLRFKSEHTPFHRNDGKGNHLTAAECRELYPNIADDVCLNDGPIVFDEYARMTEDRAAAARGAVEAARIGVDIARSRCQMAGGSGCN
jgi:hypothetical protein